MLDVRSLPPQISDQGDPTEQFLTTNLENRSFAHAFTATDPTDNNSPDADPFAYTTTS
jgi:hypothetical protein